jgi:hypothetical protein
MKGSRIKLGLENLRRRPVFIAAKRDKTKLAFLLFTIDKYVVNWGLCKA